MMLIEEAIYDYTKAYNDFHRIILQANKFYHNDCDVFQIQLADYFKVSVNNIGLYGVNITIYHVDSDTEIVEKVKQISDHYYYDEDTKSISFKIGGEEL